MRNALFAALVALIPGLLSAQEFRATLSGSITDRQGAAIAKARVIATEMQTRDKSETLTETTGEYTIPFLKPGAYQLTVEAPGLKKPVRQGLVLETAEHPVVDIPLEVGDLAPPATVTAHVP